MFSIIVAASATKLQVKRLPGFSVFVVKTLIHTKKENYLQTTNIYFLSSSNILFAHLGGPGSPMALSGTEGLSNLYIE